MINLFLLFAFLFTPVQMMPASLQQMPVRSMSSAHVTVYRPVNIEASIANQYLWTLEKMYGDYSSRLGLGREGRLRARLCRDRYDFADLTGADSVFSPLWQDGTLYVIAEDDIDVPGYKQELEAGVIRGVLEGIHRNGAPTWLVYSTAVYESGEYEGIAPPPIENVRYFSDLEERMQSATSATDLSELLFYLGNTGRFLDMKFGVGSLKRLLIEFNRPTDFSQAVRNAFHVSVPQLEREWYLYLSGLVGR